MDLETTEIDSLNDATDLSARKKKVTKPKDDLRDNQCEHRFWIKRCSLCRSIMESDNQVNLTTGKKDKHTYDELSTLVCTYDIAKTLQEMKVFQRSKLFWVYSEEYDALSLRVKSGVSLEGVSFVSAFTSAELCKQLYRLPVSSKNPLFYRKIGKIAYHPDRLAKLLIREIKHNLKTT